MSKEDDSNNMLDKVAIIIMNATKYPYPIIQPVVSKAKPIQDDKFTRMVWLLCGQRLQGNKIEKKLML